MMHILRELGGGRPEALLAEGRFFWCDVRAGERTTEELAAMLGIPDHALRPLLDFDPEHSRSRKFHVDTDHVVFLFGCLVGAEPIEVHVLVSGDYVLTVHAAPEALPDLLDVEVPDGRSEQYVIYAVLEAMLGTHF